MIGKSVWLSLWLALAASTALGSEVVKLRFPWAYPGELDTNNTFYLFTTTNIALPLTNWTVLTNVPGNVTQVVVTVTSEKQFFTMATSNLWGVSPFTNTLATAAVSLSGFILPIERVP